MFCFFEYTLHTNKREKEKQNRIAIVSSIDGQVNAKR